MFSLFTAFADWVTYSLLGLVPGTRLAEAVHFFVEDVSKIYVLLVVMIYLIALMRASLNVERVRAYLVGKRRFTAYVMASAFGVVTPFCSCSSIPVFLGFVSAGIPLGITMAFLLTSPLINEVAVVLLLSLVGWKITLLYVVVGMAIGVLGGWFLDAIHAERWLKDFAAEALKRAQQQPPVQLQQAEAPPVPFGERHAFALEEVKTIVGRIWHWVLIGVGLGAALHGFVPQEWVLAHLGAGQWWTVPLAVLLGIPLYSNATAMVPIMESLLNKGLPIGTTLAFSMSTVAASFPEFILLRQVMQTRLLVTVFLMLLVAFTLMGWVLNGVAPYLR